MYEWNIDIYLKSGVKLECTYAGMEAVPQEVLTKTFSGKLLTDIVGFAGREGTREVYVVAGEVAAFDIYM